MPFSRHKSVGVLVVGGGPGGLAPLFAAASSKKLSLLFRSGVMVINKGKELGSGDLGDYLIRSDSAAEAFLDIVLKTDEPELAALCEHPLYQKMAAHMGNAVPLALVSEWLHLTGETMARLVQNHRRDSVRRSTSALYAKHLPSGEWSTRLLDHATGRTEDVVSRSVILATGAQQPDDRLWGEQVAGEALFPRYEGKVLNSGFVLTPEGVACIAERLRGKTNPRVVIVGGSASAGSVAQVILQRLPEECNFADGAVTLLHRQPLRIFYPSVSDALSDGYTEFTPDDVCALTGRVHRLGGLRFDSREVIMRARRIGNRPPEPRLHLYSLEQGSDAGARRLLDEADLIIAAMGYRSRALPIFDVLENPVQLMSEVAGSRSLVDEHCRVLDAAGKVLPGLFGIGLATGLPPTPELGGEIGFTGQVNSLWLWQHMVGLRIVDQVLDRSGQNKNQDGALPGPGLLQSLKGVSGPRQWMTSSVYRKILQTPRDSFGRLNPPPAASPVSAISLQVPLTSPRPPKLSEHADELAQIEESGHFSNYGPVNTRFERAMISTMFKEGACCTVCNATIGLMIAICETLDTPRDPRRRYALMPSFTFAATAHAALWNGLTPLFCDIDPHTWLPCARSEEAMLEEYKGEIAVVVPYATFGNNLDLKRYERMSVKYSVPIVVDAAASLGSIDEEGKAFGSGFRWPIVFSMHATKLFSTGEGGVIYCADEARIARLRAMGSFGFEGSRSANGIGLNSKLCEVSALTALLQLERFDAVVEKRQSLSMMYARELAGWTRQQLRGQQQAYAFESVLLPKRLIGRRDQIRAAMLAEGIGTGTYFSPHLADQPHFIQNGKAGPLPFTEDVTQRIVTLPMFHHMSEAQVKAVATALIRACHSVSEPVPAPREEVILRAPVEVLAADFATSRTHAPLSRQ